LGFDLGYLRELAEDASEHPGWSGMADYFRLRHQGLRREALEALDRLVAAAVTWPLSERIAFAVWIGEKRLAYRGQPEAVLPVPLFRLLVRPTLEEWAQARPSDPWPLVWLARLSSGGSTWHAPPEPFLRQALARDPLCIPARVDLVRATLADIVFHQHELPGAYLGEAAEDLSALDEAEDLLSLADEDTRFDLGPQIAWARAEAKSWLGRTGG